jgi:alpha-beta hydrolase superfamily lysophospholipase
LAIVHGLSDHSRRYGELAQALQPERIETLGIDLRGHGESTGRRGHADSWARLQNDVRLLLEQAGRRQRGLPIFLLGHSMGGTLVLSMALEQPADLRQAGVRGLVVLSPLILPAREPPLWKIRLGHALNRIWPQYGFATQIDVNDLSQDATNVARFRDDPLRHSRITARLAVEMFAAGRRLLHSERTIDLPCLMMCGTRDLVTSTSATEHWAARHAGPLLTFRTWPGMYHEIWQERERDQVFRTIADWIANQIESSKQQSAP